MLRTLIATAALLFAPAAPREIPLPERTFPEGIAATADGTLFVGSLLRGEILRIRNGRAELFTAASDLVSVAGLYADESRGLLWACSSDPGVGLRKGKSAPALAAFALADGAPKGRWTLPGGGFCNDIAIDEKGTVWITDSFQPRLLRLDPGAKELVVHREDPRFAGKGFGLNGIASAPEGLYLVKYDSGELFRLAGETLTKIELPRPLSLPDGLKREKDGSLLVVEGSGALTRIRFDGGAAKLQTLREGLLAPTTVAPVEGGAWVVQGQLDKLFDPKKGAPVPFALAWVPLE